MRAVRAGPEAAPRDVVVTQEGGAAPGWVRFGEGTAAGLDATTLGTRGAAMDLLAGLALPANRGITVPVGSADALAAPGPAAELVTLLAGDGDDLPGLFRLSASAPLAVAGLPPAAVCLGLDLTNLDHYAQVVGRRAELCAAWAATLRLVAEHALGVPAAELGSLALDQPDPAAQVLALLALCADQGGQPYPSRPADQVALAARALLVRWGSPRAQRARRAQGVPPDLGLALHLEVQPLGGWERTGHGLLVSRDAADGGFAPSGRFHRGLRGPGPLAEGGEPLGDLPIGGEGLVDAARRLEVTLQGVVEVAFDFTEAGLTLADVSVDRRPPARALVALSVELVGLGVLDQAAAVRGVGPDAVSEMLHPRLRLTGHEQLLVRGVPASPGAALGQVVLSSERAVDLVEAGIPVVLVATETTPADLPGMLAAEGIVTSHGGSASHAAVVARGIGRPAVCGAGGLSIDREAGVVRAGVRVVREGDVVSVDGWAGAVYEGEVAFRPSEPSAALLTLLDWADGYRRLGVRANADTAEQATAALRLGAEGIGLCRTEHQFLGDRLPLIQAVLLAHDADSEQRALAALADAQRQDFRDLLRAVGERPVTVRLLDAPLHEFLPPHDEPPADAERAELVRVLREVNPMMGTRGVRLAVLHKGLYPAQVEALFSAWADVAAEGIRPQLEVMVPLVSMVEELTLVAGMIRTEAADLAGRSGIDVPYRVGTMVETPRAALLAGRLVEVAEFLSFGTNDLTQLTFGLSRDDVERRMLVPYLEQGLLPASPFVSLDEDGVGELLSIAVSRARAVRPDVKLGLCGEHGGDPRSVALCERAGLDYVSCSPGRVPVARLAAARAALEA